MSRKRWQGRGEHSKIIKKFRVHFGHEAVETLEEGIKKEVGWMSSFGTDEWMISPSEILLRRAVSLLQSPHRLPQYDPPVADKFPGPTPVKQRQERFHWAPRGGIFDRRGKLRSSLP
ncbi:MAG: hypothetical protein JRJ15_11120 [Deltaproteobacteria bacterium]|nr:hypothetical protein [Deltaproteobacteria bacterium]